MNSSVMLLLVSFTRVDRIKTFQFLADSLYDFVLAQTTYKTKLFYGPSCFLKARAGTAPTVL